MKKRVFVWVLLLMAAAVIYYEGFASRPDKTVRRYIEATMELDYEKLLSCFDPTTQKAVGGVSGLFSSFLGFDVEDLMAITPLIAADEMIEYQIDEIKVISYKGAESFADTPFLYSIMGTLLGTEAEVEFHISSEETGKESSGRIIVKKYGMQWLLPGDGDIVEL